VRGCQLGGRSSPALERKANQLEQIVTKLSIQRCLIEQALDIAPS